MFKCYVDGENGIVNVEMGGTGAEITADLCCLIRQMYKSMQKECKEIAEGFKQTLEEVFKGGDLFLTDEELEKKEENAKKETAKRLKDELRKDLKDFLKDLLKDEDIDK